MAAIATSIENPVAFIHKGRPAYIFSQKLGKFKGYGKKTEANENAPNLIQKIDNYKLYWTYVDEFDPQPIETGLDRVISQNFPSITFNGKFVLNFIGQQIFKDVGIVNFLYHMEGDDIESLQLATTDFIFAESGCEVGSDLIFFKKGKIHIHNKLFRSHFVNPFHLKSITTVAGQDNELVILNGRYGKNKGSFLYDLKENVIVGSITVSGKIVQAATLLDGKLFYLEDNVVKETKDFLIEESELFFSDPKKSVYDDRFFSTLRFEQPEMNFVGMLTEPGCDFIQEIGITNDQFCCVYCDVEGGCFIPSCEGTFSTTIDGTFVTGLIVGDFEYTFYLNGSPPPYDATSLDPICLTIVATHLTPGPEEHFCYPVSCRLDDCSAPAPLFMLSADRSSLIYNPSAKKQKVKKPRMEVKYR